MRTKQDIGAIKDKYSYHMTLLPGNEIKDVVSE